MSTTGAPAKFQGRVLPTLNADGTRRFLRPKVSRGRYWKRRAWAAYLLIALFTLIPYIPINGKPAMLLDVVHRRFTLFGTTFLPTDTMLLMLLLVGTFVGIFFLTALFGRVWCGWACPQTVYMEYVYRPLERWIEGGIARQLKLDRDGADWRRVVRYGVFVLISLYLAHTFLAYFVGVAQLRTWILGSPYQHPVAFVVMAVTTLLMLLDFTFFREQICAVACPYGRFQSVLLDRRSLIVGYDRRRGEPRLPVAERKAGAAGGDCIDCSACVITCPTGIDIRDGLQMECIHCTQCADACDVVMDKVGKPRGLVRYSSQDELDGKPRRFLRVRTVIYPLIMVAVWSGLAYALVARRPAQVWLLRPPGAPYMVPAEGRVANLVRIKIQNQSEEPATFTISLPDAHDVELSAAENPVTVVAQQQAVASIVLTAPLSSFRQGRRTVTVTVTSGPEYSQNLKYEMLGPESSHGAVPAPPPSEIKGAAGAPSTGQ
jgi:cytochrome c oxidase accessory protein FixG